MIDNLLSDLSLLIGQNTLLAPLLAFAAGVLTSVLPCSLSSIPLVIGYVGGMEADTKKAFRFSLVFVLGTAVTFTALGAAASLLGAIGVGRRWFYIILGVLMALLALQTWGIYNFIPATHLVSKSTKRGYLGAFVAGILTGVFSSPCATPVLIALLAIVAGTGNILWGIVLLLFYSIGHGTLTVAAGTFTSAFQKLIRNEKYGKWSKALQLFLGLLILAIGLYMFYLGF